MSEALTPPEPPASVEYASHIILEIGTGRTAPPHNWWEPTIAHRTLGDNERYIGIDIGSRTDRKVTSLSVREARDHTMRQTWATIIKERPEESITFLQTDARRLPLRDQSVDEVVANNLFGFGDGASKEMLRAIYCEGQRVLKDNGTFIIHDDLTPRFVSPTSLLSWLLEQDLDMPHDINRFNAGQTPETYAELAVRYGLKSSKLERHAEIEPASAQDVQDLRERTIWTLSKVATPLFEAEAPLPETSAKPETPAQQLPPAEEPPEASGRLARLKASIRRWRGEKDS